MNIFRGTEGAGGKNPAPCPFVAINRKRLGITPVLRVLPLAALLALLAAAPLKAFCSEPDTTKKSIPPELLGKGTRIEALAGPSQELQSIDSTASISKFKDEIKLIFQKHANSGLDSTCAPIFSIFSGEQITLSPIPNSKKIRLTGLSEDDWSMEEELAQLGMKKFSKKEFKVIIGSGRDGRARQCFPIFDKGMHGFIFIRSRESLKQTNSNTVEPGLSIDAIACPIPEMRSSGEAAFALKTDAETFYRSPSLAILEGSNLFIVDYTTDIIIQKYDLAPMVSSEGAPPKGTRMLFLTNGDLEYIAINYPQSETFHIFELTSRWYYAL